MRNIADMNKPKTWSFNDMISFCFVEINRTAKAMKDNPTAMR